jgi:hypothetical protein
MFLEGLFGNATAEKVLLYIGVNESAYAKQMADALETPLSVVQKQLRRLELSGVLVSRLIGRTRVFSINPRFAVAVEVRALLKRAFSLLPPSERLPFESARTRPRMTGKPLQLSPHGKEPRE